ncbi:unnamed protein product [Chrysoparadoxa australica]
MDSTPPLMRTASDLSASSTGVGGAATRLLLRAAGASVPNANSPPAHRLLPRRRSIRSSGDLESGWSGEAAEEIHLSAGVVNTPGGNATTSNSGTSGNSSTALLGGEQNDSDPEADQFQELRPEVHLILEQCQSVVPFVMLVAMQFITEHAFGLAYFGLGTALLVYCDKLLRSQVASRGGLQPRSRVLVLAAPVSFICLSQALGSDLGHPFRSLSLRPLKEVQGQAPGFWEALWSVVVADLWCRSALVSIKAAVCMWPGPSRVGQDPAQAEGEERALHLKKRKVMALLEFSGIIYRMMLPLPLWYAFYADYFAPIYLLLKAMVLGQRMKALCLAIKSVYGGELEHGRYWVAPEGSDAVLPDCSICYDEMTRPGTSHCHYP